MSIPTKFQKTSCDEFLVIAIRPTAKYTSYSAFIFLFYIFEIILSINLLIFRSSVTVHHFVILHHVALAFRRSSRLAHSSY